MEKKAPGKAFRKGMTLAALFRRFPDDATAESWFAEQRWGNTPTCPHCGSVNVQAGCQHKSMPYRCREKECAKRFSVKTGTLMQSSNLGYQTWAIAIYLMLTSLKGVSSMKLHRDLGITQKSAWHLAHRIRKTFETQVGQFNGPVEVDETHIGGLRKNMSNAKRKALKDTGRGPVGKTAVVGIKDRDTNKVSAKVVHSTDAATLIPFIEEHTARGSTVYTDEASAYQSLANMVNDYDHETVIHSIMEYVRGPVHTNGIESLWSMLKRAHKGIYHKYSPKHLERYVREFAGRHNMRGSDTLTQMGIVARGLLGKRLRYTDLIAFTGLSSGARSH